MHIVRDLPSLSLVTAPAIRQMIQQRMDAIASDEPYDAQLHGFFAVIDSGDSLEAVADTVGFDPTQRPWEILEEYANCYDLLFILDDSGFGVELLVPKTEGIPPELTAMCQRCAVPGTL